MPSNRIRKGIKKKLYTARISEDIMEKYLPFGIQNPDKVAKYAHERLMRLMGLHATNYLQKRWGDKYNDKAIKHYNKSTVPDIHRGRFFASVPTEVVELYYLNSLGKEQDPRDFMVSRRPWLKTKGE